MHRAAAAIWTICLGPLCISKASSRCGDCSERPCIKPSPEQFSLLPCSAPARAQWDAQQAANRESAYTEEGKGYGEVEMASGDKPVRPC